MSSVSSAITTSLLGGNSPRTGANGLASNGIASGAFDWTAVALEAVRSVARQGVGHVVQDAIRGDAHWNWRDVVGVAAQDVAVLALAGALSASQRTRDRQSLRSSPSDAAVGEDLVRLAFGQKAASLDPDADLGTPINWDAAVTLAGIAPDFSSLEQYAGEHVKWKIGENIQGNRTPGLSEGQFGVETLDEARAMLIFQLGVQDASELADRSTNPAPYSGRKVSLTNTYGLSADGNRLSLNEPYFLGSTVAEIYVGRTFMEALSDKLAGRGLQERRDAIDVSRARAAELADQWPGHTDELPLHARIANDRVGAAVTVVTGVPAVAASILETNRRMQDFVMIRVYENRFTGSRTFKIMQFQQTYDPHRGGFVWAPAVIDKGQATYRAIVHGGGKR